MINRIAQIQLALRLGFSSAKMSSTRMRSKARSVKTVLTRYAHTLELTNDDAA